MSCNDPYEHFESPASDLPVGHVAQHDRVPDQHVVLVREFGHARIELLSAIVRPALDRLQTGERRWVVPDEFPEWIFVKSVSKPVCGGGVRTGEVHSELVAVSPAIPAPFPRRSSSSRGRPWSARRPSGRTSAVFQVEKH